MQKDMRVIRAVGHDHVNKGLKAPCSRCGEIVHIRDTVLKAAEDKYGNAEEKREIFSKFMGVIFKSVDCDINADITEKIVIKIPIFNKEDIVFLKKYYDEFKNLKVRIYCSVGNNMSGKNNKNVVTESLNAYRNLIDEVFKTNMESIHILPQMHVLLWGNKRGV